MRCTEHALRNVFARRAAVAEAVRRGRRVQRHARSVCAGRPSAGGPRTRRGLVDSKAGWAVRPLAASAPTVWLESGGTRGVFNAESLLKHSFSQPTGSRVRSVMPHSFSSFALRRTAAPGRRFGAGTGFARAGGVGANGCHKIAPGRIYRNPRAGACALSQAHEFTSAGGMSASSTPRPNPSVEVTSTIKLRLLAAAPHVKR